MKELRRRIRTHKKLRAHKTYTYAQVALRAKDIFGSLVIDIHGADMTSHWDDAAIPLRDIYSMTNDVFALLQYNAPFNSETKRMKRILDAKYTESDLKTIAESSTHLDLQEINEL